AQAGRLFTRGLPKQGQLDVIWGPNHDDKCSFTYHATRNETDMRPQTIPVQCIPHSN
ncbi:MULTISPECIES: FimD/PapC C-terminal domain-containing protein, partial [Enterobacterales]